MPRLGSGIPLVGRTDELRRLRAALTDAERARARGVLLAGDAGVGKTRLLAELTDTAAAAGHLVLTGRCLDLREGGLPYLPFVEALAPLTASADADVARALAAWPVLARLLPQLPDTAVAAFEDPQAASSEEDVRRVRTELDLGQLQLFDAVSGVLGDLAAHRTVVLVLEDLHWADGSTRNLLSFVFSRLRQQRLLVVGSYRGEDVHRRHPLRALLAELVRLTTVERIDLPPLSEVETQAFVEALAEEPLPPGAVADLIRRCEGNPFFAEELLASGAERDDVPVGLAEMLLARLERLSAAARGVLRAVAVAGDAVTHTALAAVCGMAEPELDEAVREAVHHHVLVVEQGCYQFRHALLREAVYGDLLPGERTRMHAAYAARIRPGSTRRGDAARLAYHSLRSRNLGVALAALVRAADEAEHLGAPGTALRHIEQALDIWNAVPTSERPEGCDEVALLMRATVFAGRAGEPERSVAFARSAVELPGPGQTEDRAVTWRRLAESLMALESTFDEAVAAIERAWGLVAEAGPSRERACVLATRAQILRGTDRLEEAAWSARAAVADARAVGARSAEAAALATLGVLADVADDAPRARRLLKQAEDTARAAGALGVELRAVYFRALSHDDHAELDSAVALYRDAVARAEQAGLLWSPWGISSRARLLALRYLTGDWPGDEERDQPDTGVSGTVAAVLNSTWAHLAVARGRFAAAERLLVDLCRHRRGDLWIAIAASAAGAELAFWRGDPRAAADAAEAGMDWFERMFPHGLAGIRIGALGVEACAAWHAVARRPEGLGKARESGGRGTGDAERASDTGARLLARIERCLADGRPRSGVLGREARAWLARARAAASGLRGPADPALWERAVAAFDFGAVYEQALCRWHYAEALLVAGETARAAEPLRAAHAVALRLGAVPLRSAVDDLARRAGIELAGQQAPPRRAGPDPLTVRERAVLERVALGLTNKQVGEQLYISEKTVSVHLSRVMAKLGASRRAEAVAIAYDRGLLVGES